MGITKSIVKVKPLSEQVADQITDWIVNGQLKPGEKINSETLARSFGVSRTPVREALKSLELSSLVISKPYVGYSVTQLSKKDLEEIYVLRKILESQAIKESARHITQTDIDSLEAIQAEIEKILKIEPCDNKLIFKLNYEFHKKIFSISQMPRLCEMINSLWSNLSFFRLLLANNPKYGILAIIEHREYINALKERDISKLEKMTIKNLNSHEQEMPGILEKYNNIIR